MKYYILSDIHGFCSLFKKTLREAGWYDDEEEKRLVLLGDLFDRGEEAAEMQAFVLELMAGGETILIRGNHEDLFCDLVTKDRGRPLRHHLHNGTYLTLEQLTGLEGGFGWGSHARLAKAGQDTPLYTAIIPAMLDYYETRQFVFTHAWVPCRREYGALVPEEDWRGADAAAWREARWINAMDAAQTAQVEGKTVVSGHFHCSYGHCRYEQKGSEYGPDADFSPYIAPGVISLDACTAYSGRMNCVILEDEDAPRDKD